MTRRPARLRLAVALAVVAIHLALLLWWLQADRLPRRAPAETPRVAVRLIAPVLRPPPVPPPREAATPERRPRDVLARRPSPIAPTRPNEPVPSAAEAPQAITVAPMPEPRASDALAEPRPSLMDGEATRRAIRAAARDPGLAAQAGRQGPALQTPDERLGERVQQSAKGDCLKGEYLGGGMGLLSLPFLAAAAVGGQCRR